MTVLGFDHVQLAYPPGCEAAARRFYGEVLGFTEIPKPEDMRIDIDLAAGATLIMAEAVVFGRAAMGETMNEGFFADRWRLSRGGRLVYAESARFDGAIAEKLGRAAVTAGGIAIATVLIAPGGEGQLAAVRALGEQFAGEVGISAWDGIAVARLCAKDGAQLRHDLIALLAALGTTVPRLWLQ